MKLFIRLKKSGTIEEKLQQDRQLMDMDPLAITNAFILEYISQNTRETGAFNIDKVYESLGVVQRPGDRKEGCPLFVADLKHAFEDWLLKDAKTPIQRFNLPTRMMQEIGGDPKKKKSPEDDYDVPFSIDSHDVSYVSYYWTTDDTGKFIETTEEEKRAKLLWIESTAWRRHFAYKTMAYYLDMTSSRPVPYVPVKKKLKGQSWISYEKDRNGELIYDVYYGEKGDDGPEISVAKETKIVEEPILFSFARLYTVAPDVGLIALAWAEIAYAMENNITFKYCGQGKHYSCGRIFQTSRSHKVYCSDRCSEEAYRKRPRKKRSTNK